MEMWVDKFMSELAKGLSPSGENLTSDANGNNLSAEQLEERVDKYMSELAKGLSPSGENLTSDANGNNLSAEQLEERVDKYMSELAKGLSPSGENLTSDANGNNLSAEHLEEQGLMELPTQPELSNPSVEECEAWLGSQMTIQDALGLVSITTPKSLIPILYNEESTTLYDYVMNTTLLVTNDETAKELRITGKKVLVAGFRIMKDQQGFFYFFPYIWVNVENEDCVIKVTNINNAVFMRCTSDIVYWLIVEWSMQNLPTAVRGFGLDLTYHIITNRTCIPTIPTLMQHKSVTQCFTRDGQKSMFVDATGKQSLIRLFESADSNYRSLISNFFEYKLKAYT